MIELNKGSFGLEETYQVIKNIIDKKHPDQVKRFIKVEDNFAYATNGRVMIKYEILANDGFYESVSCKKTQIILQRVQFNLNYPDCNELLNFCESYDTTNTFNTFKFKNKKKCYEFNTHLPIKFAIETGIGLNYDFTQIAVDLVCESITYDSPEKPVLFNFQNNTKFLVMPLMLD